MRDLESDVKAWTRMFAKHAGKSEDVAGWLRETLIRCGWPTTPNDTMRSLLWKHWRRRWIDDMRVAERDQRVRASAARKKDTRPGVGRSIWDVLHEPGGF